MPRGKLRPTPGAVPGDVTGKSTDRRRVAVLGAGNTASAMAARCGRDGDRSGVWRRFWAGLFLGAGGSNLYDGTVQHMVL